MSTLKLAEQAADSPLNGVTLHRVVFEALGAASVCWKGEPIDREFDSDTATAVGEDLIAAIKKLVEIGINQQGIDARYGVADSVLRDGIFAAPALA